MLVGMLAYVTFKLQNVDWNDGGVDIDDSMLVQNDGWSCIPANILRSINAINILTT